MKKSTERLDKILSHMGFGSRSEIRKLVKQKAVRVNGTVMKDSGLQIEPYEDEILVHGEKVNYRQFIYIMMNKPPGVVSATEDNRDRTVIDLLQEEHKHFQPFPVGRLDKDTEGLLLLSNDGKLAHDLLSPKKHVPKTYYVKVKGRLTKEDQMIFNRGVTLEDGYVTMPAKLVILDAGEDSAAEITIMEGKFHQVKRMFRSVNKEVTYLQRLVMGPLKLDNSLTPGAYRELTNEELLLLKGGNS
jgi:16S rRNA pseudouridine516 synthase